MGGMQQWTTKSHLERLLLECTVIIPIKERTEYGICIFVPLANNDTFGLDNAPVSDLIGTLT